ncbi:MAG: hypothetical protein J0L95_04940 [Candidatus Accumulibacter sp.]|jgi:hypothetical protein|uniref:hypothetical protein n=1 Tax=Accumulibacter sp. TaxID=2053492 RepID=UPI001AD217E2|nr:hypothetical protein [Accumulibacter sp.]MBN8437374.1 hypothetical protein [Accumulibacter sp.]
MTDASPNIANVVRTVFLVPHDFSESAKPLTDLSSSLPDGLRQIALAFFDSLHGVIRTLSIPFHYTYSQVHSLHWQRFLMAERIRARGIENEEEREPAALKIAKERFAEYLQGEGREVVVDDVLARLKELQDEPESLAAARELTRQGVVLVWSAVEVLARDSFVFLLNRRPVLAEQLLAEQANRKRFSVDRIDWQTLAAYGYDLSENLGTFLISKADLTSVPAIRDAYGALFPTATELGRKLADRRLWDLCQKRNLIVHRRGIVDQQYLANTGDILPVGADLWIRPSEVEDLLEAGLHIGTEIISEVANAG